MAKSTSAIVAHLFMRCALGIFRCAQFLACLIWGDAVQIQIQRKGLFCESVNGYTAGA